MIICMSCTKNWVKYLEISLYSVLLNNNIKKVYLFLEVDFFEAKNFFEKKFGVKIMVKNYCDILSKYIHNNLNTIYSSATLVRLIFTKIIEEDRVIYLDVDTITLGDISYLWNLNLDNYYFAGVEDRYIYNFIDYLDLNDIPIKCINAGVLVMNLKKIKDDKIDSRFINDINQHNYKFPDQDVINKNSKGKILFVSNEFNSSMSTGYSDNIIIMHYSMFKIDWVKGHYKSELWFKMEEKYLEEKIFN